MQWWVGLSPWARAARGLGEWPEVGPLRPGWEGLLPLGGRRAPQGSQGAQWAGVGQRAEQAPERPCVPWQLRPPLGTDAHFPLFMLLQDSHSFQLSKLGTFHRLCFNQSLLCGLPGGQPCPPHPRAWGRHLRFPNWVPKGFFSALTSLWRE